MNSGRRPHARAFAICSLLAFAALPASAQVTLTTLGTAYTQNFDTLPSSGSITWSNNVTLTGWYHARTGSGATLVADTGSNNAGNFYSYGAASRSLIQIEMCIRDSAWPIRRASACAAA